MYVITYTRMSRSIEVFAAHAGEYQALRRRLVPCFDAFYGTAVDLAGRRGGAVGRVLDVGAGTGLLSAAMLARHPGVQLVLLDGAPEMLAEARKHLPGVSLSTHVGDMRDALPDGPFDAVVSALAIHHLEDAAKRELFARVHDVLRPGGAFVNAEHVAGPTPWLQRTYRELWRRDCRAAGASEEEIDQAEIRMRVDRCTDVATQLGWMRAAGLRDADCFFKHTHFAVLAGWREDR
jgi:tRNA (cmo5U34)-methyltransferase